MEKSNRGCYVLLCKSRNFYPGCDQSPPKAVRKVQPHNDFTLESASTYIRLFLGEDSPSCVTFWLGDLRHSSPFLKFSNCYQWLRPLYLASLKHQSTWLCWVHLLRGQTLVRYKAQLYKTSSSCRLALRFHIWTPIHMSDCGMVSFW